MWLRAAPLAVLLACGPKPAPPVEPVPEPPAKPAEPAEPVQEVIVSDLEELPQGDFSFTVDGTVQTGMRTEGECVWVEIVHGDRAEDGVWAAWTGDWNSEKDVTIKASSGEVLALSWRKLRMRTAASWSARYDGTEDDCPPPMKEWATEHGNGVSAAEYCLVKGKTYWGRVVGETYMLPPDGPGGAPQSATNAVLNVMDARPADDAELPALTPLFSGWTY